MEVEETTEIKVVEEKENTNIEQVNPPKEEESDYWKYIKMSLIEVDFNDLLKKNNIHFHLILHVLLLIL